MFEGFFRVIWELGLLMVFCKVKATPVPAPDSFFASFFRELLAVLIVAQILQQKPSAVTRSVCLATAGTLSKTVEVQKERRKKNVQCSLEIQCSIRASKGVIS